jgi:hypothetical protein
MAGLFAPKAPPVVPIVNPADAQNRQNDALARTLQAGGTNADMTSGAGVSAGGGGGARQGTLTGLN